jgi:hypothetical protein
MLKTAPTKAKEDLDLTRPPIPSPRMSTAEAQRWFRLLKMAPRPVRRYVLLDDTDSIMPLPLVSTKGQSIGTSDRCYRGMKDG